MKTWLNDGKVLLFCVLKLIIMFCFVLRGYQQQDAHEFMRYLLDRLHCELLQLLPYPSSNSPFITPKGTSTIVTAIFGGLLQNEVNCLICGTESKKHDPFLGKFGTPLLICIASVLVCFPLTLPNFQFFRIHPLKRCYFISNLIFFIYNF